MNSLEKIMSSWETVLNEDDELLARNRSPYSTIEGRSAVQLEIGKAANFSVDVKDGKFKVRRGTSKNPLLHWKVPNQVFKDVMLGEHRLIFSMLDPQGKLIFDTPHFTHWNGATVIEMLLLAHEMTAKNPEMKKIVTELDC